MIRINLLPVRAAKKKEMGRQQLVLFAGILFLALFGNAFWWWTSDVELQEKKQQQAKLENDIKQLDRIIGEVKSIKDDKQALEDKLAVLEVLRKGRTGPVKLLDALAKLTPQKVWFTETSESGGTLSLKGGAISNDDLAELMKQMKQSPFFSNPTLKGAKLVEDKTAGAKFIEFELTCGVNYAA